MLKGLTSESSGCEKDRNTSWISGLYKLNNLALMLQQFKGLRRSIWYVKGVLFVNKSYAKGESFLLKMDYKGKGLDLWAEHLPIKHC